MWSNNTPLPILEAVEGEDGVFRVPDITEQRDSVYADYENQFVFNWRSVYGTGRNPSDPNERYFHATGT